MWRVLRRRDFALVWTGGLISLAGDWVLFVGLPLYVYDRTGSTLATGAMFLVRLVPQVLLGSVAGVFVDRWDRRRTLVVANVLLAVALVPMLVGAAAGVLWPVYLGSLAASVLQQFVGPAEDALLPRLVDEEQLVPANALNALNDNLARLGGPPLGALLYAGAGIGGVVVADALSFLVAALLVGLVRADARPLGDEQADTATSSALLATWRDWLAGLRLVRASRTVAVLLLFAALTGLGEGALSALFVPFVRTVLHAQDLAYGGLLAAQAAGGLLGGVVIGRYGRALRPVQLWGLGALGLALIDALIFLYPLALPGVVLALALMVAVGVPVAGMRVGLATERQTAVADAFRGRLSGAYLATSALTMAFGTVAAGALGERVGVTPLLMVQVAVYALAGTLVLLLGASREVTAGPPDLTGRADAISEERATPADAGARR